MYPSALPAPSSGIILICCNGSRFRRITFPLTGSITVGVDPQFDRDFLFSFQIMPALADRAVATRSKFVEPGMGRPSKAVKMIEQNSFSTVAERFFNALL